MLRRLLRHTWSLWETGRVWDEMMMAITSGGVRTSEHQNIINIDITLLTGAVQLGLVGVHLLVLLWIICQPTMDTEETSNNMNTSQSVLPGQKPPCLVNILWRNFLFPVIRLCWRWWPLATDHITMTRRAPDAPGVAEWYDGVSWCHGSTVYWRLL